MAAMLVKVLVSVSRLVLAGLILVVLGAITWSWVWTVPNCVTSGWGTARYSARGEGAFGCWPANFTRERLREEAFREWARESERR